MVCENSGWGYSTTGVQMSVDIITTVDIDSHPNSTGTWLPEPVTYKLLSLLTNILPGYKPRQVVKITLKMEEPFSSET